MDALHIDVTSNCARALMRVLKVCIKVVNFFTDMYVYPSYLQQGTKHIGITDGSFLTW